MPDSQSNSAASVQNRREEAEMNKQKYTILYQRLSRDDGEDGVSNSIVNQRLMLEEYAEKHGLVPYISLQDDGYTGVDFNRPGWQELITKVEADEVSCIILKDSSRMARNYLQAGLFREMFRERGVRLICVNDGTDTSLGEDDFTPFREIMSEWYARDCSRKIKSAFAAKGRAGKPMTNKVIYGFRKDPEDKNHWIVDSEAADVVRRIYALTVEGHGTFQIARMLHEEGIESPGYYLAKRGIVANKNALEFADPCGWRQSVVGSILSKPEYAGHIVNFRTYKPSFKSKKTISVPPEDWLIFENAHEAVVPQETWDLVQKLRETKRRTDNRAEPNPLTGIIYCAQCGGRMYNHRGPNKKDHYQCSGYTSPRSTFNPSHCSPHYVTSEAVRTLVLEVIRKTAGYVREHEAAFIEKMREASVLRQGETLKTHKRQIAKNERRIADLEKMFKTLYEDRVSGVLSVERFSAMTGDYEREQAELREKNAALQAEIDAFNADAKNADQFVELVQKYTRFDELTTPLLNEFVERIDVHEGVWSEGGRYGSRSQQIDITLKYIGRFDTPDTRAPEEIEAERIAEEKRERRRAQQRETSRRYDAKKKAERLAAAEAESATSEADSDIPKPAA